MKKIILILAIFLLGIAAVLAQESHDSEIEEGKKIVESKTGCGKLSNEQLEAIGDYYMEQMHPGESHEIMDNMMGGEGSESLKQVHINMAKRLYCNENVYIGYGMMGSGGMMGMMNMINYSNYGYWNIFWILLFAAVIFLIVWIIHRFRIKNTERVRRHEKGYRGVIFMEGKNVWVWILAAAALLLLLGSFGMGGYGIMGFGMGFGFLFMLLFWGLIIWLIVTLINSAQSNKKDDSDPLIILKKRYAKGEITKKEFESMKKKVG